MSRGHIGLLPRPPRVEDEAYLEYVQSFRKMLIQNMFPILAGGGEARYADWKAKNKPESDHDDIDDIKREFRKAPVTLTWQRFLRTQQEMMWRQTRDGFLVDAEGEIKKMDEAEKKGPGKLIYDKNFEIPNYTRQEIHLQPGGYTDDPLAGIVYHYGTMVFYEGTNDQDELHKELAQLTTKPEGKCERILDLACSVGQATNELKILNPDADVIGIDVSLHLLRYAHYRSTARDIDVTYQQCLAEDMPYEDGHFDAVLSYLLYHEVTEEKIEEIVKEVHRVLRPGGTFSIFDFPNNHGQTLEPTYRFLIDFDSKNNCEPYSVGFVHCDFFGILRRAGFEVADGPPTSNPFLQSIVATKKA